MQIKWISIMILGIFFYIFSAMALESYGESIKEAEFARAGLEQKLVGRKVIWVKSNY
jgi:hypothetical protein